MEENSNEENIPKTYEELHQARLQNAKDKQERMEKVRLDTIEWMKTNLEIQKYLNGFNSYYVEDFITGYARDKSIFMEYGEFYENLNEKYESQFIEDAEECLKNIQLKKLFDLRCQWGAELVTIPEIIISWDFWYWSKDVLNCNFISRVEWADVELYINYINSNNYDKYCEPSLNDISSYNEENGGELPAWFEYHNTYTGNNKYLLLPDLRVKKENVYRSLWRKEEDEKIQAKYDSGELVKHIPDNRPSIATYQYHDVLNFMKKFETAETIRKFEANHKHASMASLGDEEQDDESDYLDQQVQSINLALTALPHVRIAVEANSDWRKALIIGYDKFERGEIIKCLKPAFSDYLFRLENNIKFSNDREDDFHLNLTNSVKEQILRGRELNGEPRDFNF